MTTRDSGLGVNMELYVLALDLGDRKSKVGSVDLPTSGASWTPSVSLGFTPQLVDMIVTQCVTEGLPLVQRPNPQPGEYGHSQALGSTIPDT